MVLGTTVRAPIIMVVHFGELVNRNNIITLNIYLVL